ncbi:MAG: RsmD family RNA methyltransferase [Flavobacteriales bacterium]|mgnify:CR=1 FL=1|nr:RsmD family RNA methyltransferase [Flavobacteriales bacterium]
MRIVAGRLKGKKFDAPQGFRSRPTTNFAREALFNVLENRIDFSTVSMLDLFSGTGAFCYEAFSRGAENIMAVDNDPGSAKFIAGMMRKFGMNHARFHKADVFRFVQSAPGKFDLVLADPPFDLEDLEHIPQAVISGQLLVSNGWLVLEHPPGKDFSMHAEFVELRKYGHVHFSFFRNSQP